jgi:predicted nuclease of predicted toxin-antitoxin system
MKFLANENFPYPSIRLLREAGYEVKSIGEEAGGMSDEEILKLAVKELSVILTFDRDYGELIFKYRKDSPPAVVYFRTKGEHPDDAGKAMLNLLANPAIKLEGLFTVIEESGIRQRKLRLEKLD